MCAMELTRIYCFGLFYYLMAINPTNLFSEMLKWVCIKLPSLPLEFYRVVCELSEWVVMILFV